uniref:Proteasome inhibitor PI31 subunit n=1 Tax=Ixodes ricinus TaxID=34613 RepID=A0A0K8RF26_IXORI
MASSGGASGSGVDKLFGLELLFKSCKEALRSKDDALVLLVHYLLVRSGKRCVGTGEEWTKPLQSTELLPPEWNANQAVYTLRYTQGTERYLLKVLRADGFLLVNVLNIRKEKTASTNFSVDKHVSDDFSDCSRAFKDLDVVVGKVTQDVVSTLESIDTAHEASTSSSPSRNASQEYNPLHIPSRQPGIEWNPLQEPGRLGQRDLNPFYTGPGGGMIMDPRQMPRPHHSDPGVGIPGLPRGAVPPGARFDPFGPPHPNNPGNRHTFAGPSPDHLPPPPDYDDMFS